MNVKERHFNSKYTEELRDRICAILRLGNTRIAAGRIVGVAASTISRWMDDYDDFRNAVELAEGLAEKDLLSSILAKAEREKGGSKTMLEILSRRYPHWRPSQALELTGVNGGPLQIQAVDYRSAIDAIAPVEEESEDSE